MRRFSLSAFLLVALASVVPDLALMFIAELKKNMALSYQIREWLKYSSMVPVGGLLFGIFFGSACLLSQSKQKFSLNAIIAVSLLFAFLEIGIPYIVTLTIPLLKHASINPVLVVKAAYAFFVALVVRASDGLNLNFGFMPVVIAAVLSLSIAWAPLLTRAGFPAAVAMLPSFWHLIMGTYFAIFAARQ